MERQSKDHLKGSAALIVGLNISDCLRKLNQIVFYLKFYLDIMIAIGLRIEQRGT